jgi:hypothetical protein
MDGTVVMYSTASYCTACEIHPKIQCNLPNPLAGLHDCPDWVSKCSTGFTPHLQEPPGSVLMLLLVPVLSDFHAISINKLLLDLLGISHTGQLIC